MGILLTQSDLKSYRVGDLLLEQSCDGLKEIKLEMQLLERGATALK